MKFLLVLSVVLVGIWLWRANRPATPKPDKPPRKAAPQPQDIVSCALCSLHVPSVDAVQGKSGVYCCSDHLRRAEH